MENDTELQLYFIFYNNFMTIDKNFLTWPISEPKYYLLIFQDLIGINLKNTWTTLKICYKNMVYNMIYCILLST